MILYESDVNTSASSFFNRFASNFYVRSWSRSSNIMCSKTHTTKSNAYNTNKHTAQGYRGEIRGAGRGLIAGQISSTVLSSRWTSSGSPEGHHAEHAIDHRRRPIGQPANCPRSPARICFSLPSLAFIQSRSWQAEIRTWLDRLLQQITCRKSKAVDGAAAR